ncbi:MAG: hypothetical protein JHC81_01895 [Brevundimonas sp.]|uniref:hypothetical protein n=1 Tax=Brevundimonas sp. TaxID=1871086 RepID=UPI001A2AC98B|nr:hypothetical protein [Brevundimonas sp.]MBJ7446260.1 hypothetical protein [Brevundimonas sp.]
MSVFAKTDFAEGLAPTALDAKLDGWRAATSGRRELFVDPERGAWLRAVATRLRVDPTLQPLVQKIEDALDADPTPDAMRAFLEALDNAVEQAYPWITAVRRHQGYAAGITSDHNLDAVDVGILRQIEDDSVSNPDTAAIVNEALSHLKGRTLLTSIQAAAMYDVYGEALVQRLLRQRFGEALTIRKVKSKTSAPDFECVLAVDNQRGRTTPLTFYVEVKTLDVAGGAATHDLARETALDVNIDLESQIEGGKRVAFAAREMAPWRRPGDRDYRSDSLRFIAERCIDRCKNVFKATQFKLGPTFACIVFVRTQSFDQGPAAVFPTAYDLEADACLSGFIYMTAFGRIGWQVHQRPGFEGAGTLDGVLTREGLLVDDAVGLNAAGLLVLDYQRGYRLDGVYDSLWTDVNFRWSNIEAEDVLSLACDAWNDLENSNPGKVW